MDHHEPLILATNAPAMPRPRPTVADMPPSLAKRTDWAHLRQQCIADPQLDEHRRTTVLRSIDALERMLGHSFLADALPNRGHPLLWNLVTSPPGQWGTITWLAETLQALAGCPGFDGLLTKLRLPREFTEAQQVATIARRFLTAGFLVELEPRVAIDNVIKRPDFVAATTDGSRRLFVEVTQLQDSKALSESLTALRDMPLLGHVPVKWSGRLLAPLDEQRRVELSALVDATAERAHREQNIATLMLADEIAFAAAPPARLAELESWASTNNCTVDSFAGPNIPNSGLHRIGRALCEKSQQLPPSQAGAVVVYLGPESPWLQAERLSTTCAHLGEELPKYPHVKAVLLVADRWRSAFDEDKGAIHHYSGPQHAVTGYGRSSHFALLSKIDCKSQADTALRRLLDPLILETIFRKSALAVP